MSLRISTLKFAVGSSNTSFIRWMSHALARPAPLQTAIDQRAIDITTSPTLYSQESHYQDAINTRPELPNLPTFGGDVELMAVPKKKVSPHKRGIRNGPKALKPIPMIIRCKVCGRVKLPHFFCCSGIKPNPGEHDSGNPSSSPLLMHHQERN